jgi:hypothetical protein
MEQARSVDIELNPDCAPETGPKFILKAKSIWRKFGKSVSLTHFVVVDIPALCLLILAIILDLHTHEFITVTFICLWVLDVLCCWIVFTDDEEGIHASIDVELVH